MRAFVLALILSLNTLAALADPILVEMVDDKRLGWKARKHFWEDYRGPVVFIYRTADNQFIQLPEKLTTVPDKRTYEKRHPYEVRINRVLTFGSGGANFIKLFVH